MAAQLSAYQEAVEHPGLVFADPDLRLCAPECDAMGLPKARSGNMAVVFRLQGQGGDWAVRCFQHLRSEQGERYAEISRRLRGGHLPYFVPFAFQERGVLVAGSWQPIVKMAWAGGERLDAYLRAHLGDRSALEDLAASWLHLLHDLEQGGIAHGDLQHGNVLVDSGRLVLLDYDGMYVPSLAARPSLELGHPNYQHPGRSHQDFGPWLDRFSGWVVFLSIAALACRPELWREQGAGDECLLFRREDFLDPHAAVWQRLRALGRPGLTELAERLLRAASRPPREVPALPRTLPLRDVLAEAAKPAAGRVTLAGAPAPRPSPVPTRAVALQVERAPDDWLPPDATQWVGSAAGWLMPQAAPIPEERLRPAPLDRWIAAAWLAGVWLLLALGPAVRTGLALGVLPWTSLGALVLYLHYRLGDDARRAHALRRQVSRLRRDERRTVALLNATSSRYAAALTASQRHEERLRAQAQEVQGELRRQERALRQGLGLQGYHRREAELRDLAQRRREERLRAFQITEERRVLESHRVMDDPLLDVRRVAKLQLVAAGILSAYDLQAVGEQLAVGRDGRRHHIEAIDPERARRIAQWHREVTALAHAAVPAALPPLEEHEAEEELRRALQDLRLQRHAALREFLRDVAGLRAEAARTLQTIDGERQSLALSWRSEAQAYLGSMRAAQTRLREVRWQAAKAQRAGEGLQEVCFRRFCQGLVPSVLRRGVQEP